MVQGLGLRVRPRAHEDLIGIEKRRRRLCWPFMSTQMGIHHFQDWCIVNGCRGK